MNEQSLNTTASHPSAATAPYRRLLLTGAGGNLGRDLRQGLAAFAQYVRLSDIAGLPKEAQAHEEIVSCNLADKSAVNALVRDCDAIVHLGGISVERAFEEILEANIRGVFNLYEAARIHGVRRVVFASSNHATGFYRQDERVNPDMPHRPDGYYGISKAFGEDLSRFYFDRYGIETVCLRIGSCFPEAADRRMLSSWLSLNDLTELIRCSLFTPAVGHHIVYGVSANHKVWWDNEAAAAKLGWAPRDSAEQFRAKVESTPPPAPDAPSVVFQGGNFCAAGPFED